MKNRKKTIPNQTDRIRLELNATSAISIQYSVNEFSTEMKPQRPSRSGDNPLNYFVELFKCVQRFLRCGLESHFVC